MAEIVYVPRPPHACELPSTDDPDPRIKTGTIVRCKKCGALYTLAAGWKNAAASKPPHWRRLEWNEIFVHRFFGRIPPPTQTQPVPNTEPATGAAPGSYDDEEA